MIGRLVAMVVVAAVVGRFGGPVGDVVGAVGTAAHEAGHAAAADVLTGRVVSITVFHDGGGVTVSEVSGSSWRTFLVAGAGYPATLLAALALLTGALHRTASSRRIAAAGALATAAALLLWTPFNSAVAGVDDGDQRFTWLVLALATALLAGAAALPDRLDGGRRVVLGALAFGLVTDAFRAGRDLVTIEGGRGTRATATDADALADATGILGATAWAWLLRAALFAIAAAWVWFGVRRWGAGEAKAPPP